MKLFVMQSFPFPSSSRLGPYVFLSTFILERFWPIFHKEITVGYKLVVCI